MDESEDREFVHRSAQEVARRCLALLAVIERSYDEQPSELWARTDRDGLSEYFSSAEAAFFRSESPSQQSRVNFGWRAEALIPLLWALEKAPTMPPLNERVDLSQYIVVQHAASHPTEFIASASLRPAAELDEAEAAIYHEHWRVRDAQLFGKPMPPELDPDIVYERRYALSWLVGWGDDWDDVPTDT